MFFLFLILSILSFVVLSMMYLNLSFIDYPYLFSGIIFLFLALYILRLLKTN